MNDDEVRRYLGRSPSNRPPTPVVPLATPRVRTGPPRRATRPQESFKKFTATHLLCPRCKQAMPVRERLLLVLADGDLYDFLCQACGTSCGTRKAGN